jgi:hypothetical protein
MRGGPPCAQPESAVQDQRRIKRQLRWSPFIKALSYRLKDINENVMIKLEGASFFSSAYS